MSLGSAPWVNEAESRGTHVDDQKQSAKLTIPGGLSLEAPHTPVAWAGQATPWGSEKQPHPSS